MGAITRNKVAIKVTFTF